MDFPRALPHLSTNNDPGAIGRCLQQKTVNTAPESERNKKELILWAFSSVIMFLSNEHVETTPITESTVSDQESSYNIEELLTLQDSFHFCQSSEWNSSEIPFPRKKRIKKVVSFDKCEIREYDIVVGDHPSIKSGVTHSIGWRHSRTMERGTCEYEASRKGRRSRIEL